MSSTPCAEELQLYILSFGRPSIGLYGTVLLSLTAFHRCFLRGCAFSIQINILEGIIALSKPFVFFFFFCSEHIYYNNIPLFYNLPLLVSFLFWDPHLFIWRFLGNFCLHFLIYVTLNVNPNSIIYSVFPCFGERNLHPPIMTRIEPGSRYQNLFGVSCIQLPFCWWDWP